MKRYDDGIVAVYLGDCLDVLATLDADSVDAVVTDPPYGLEFMGKDWDRPWAVGFSETGYTDAKRMQRPSHGSSRNPMCRACRKHQRGAVRCECEAPDFDERPADASRSFGEWCERWASECLRVLKPGGHLLAFGGTRTYHRLAAGIEDAGFEVRDCLAWLYGNGFPKSLDVSKALDKRAGHWRGRAGAVESDNQAMGGANYERIEKGEPVTAAAAAAGWGTALKPAHEPIILARKPLRGTVADTWLAHGTGALNIEACRVGDEVRTAAFTSLAPCQNNRLGDAGTAEARRGTQGEPQEYVGRWPANVALDDAAADELDRQTGTLTSGANPTRRGSDKFRDAYGEFKGQEECEAARGADSGGASRFFPVFRYEAKAGDDERPRVGDVAHPTVKPVALMRWLVRLVTPPGGVVLDPFLGSGTTAEACTREGFRCIGIEREEDYMVLIEARLAKPTQIGLALGEAAS